MDRWVLGQLAFWYSFYKVKPAKVVDALVDFWVDLATPGGGTGESNWWMRGVRSIERSTSKTTKELEIRQNLRNWDRDCPQIHHELIVRYVVGAIASLVATTVYNSLFRPSRPKRYHR